MNKRSTPGAIWIPRSKLRQACSWQMSLYARHICRDSSCSQCTSTLRALLSSPPSDTFALPNTHEARACRATTTQPSLTRPVIGTSRNRYLLHSFVVNLLFIRRDWLGPTRAGSSRLAERQGKCAGIARETPARRAIRRIVRLYPSYLLVAASHRTDRYCSCCREIGGSGEEEERYPRLPG